MKLNAGQLARQLKEGLAPVYAISGDEPLLAGEAADQVRAACRREGSEERLVFHVDRAFDWGQLHDTSHSLSLFAQKRLVELRIAGGKPGDEGAKAILAWLESPPPDPTLLISLPKLDGSTQRTKWAKGLTDHANSRLVQIWPVDAQQLPGWMRERLAAEGITPSAEALDLLSTRVEGNLLAAEQEIQKLKLYCDAGHLDLETVQRVVADSARFDVFSLVDAMLLGQAEQALRILQGLRGEGVEAPVVLWALAREIRSLASMAHGLKQQIPLDRIFASQRPPVWDKRKPVLGQALQRHPAMAWDQWLQKAQQIDEQIKGQQPGSPWDGLSAMVLAVAGVRLHLHAGVAH
jgi:DNA polymerase-3 subunit delta